MIRSLTGQAQGFLGTSKPFSAVSEWIDRLCTERYSEEEYDGIPELVEAINLQSTGPTEASRALRKKLKYSNIHGQKRALTILKALVENSGQRFQTTFANERLIEQIKLMSQDELIDLSVRRKLMRVLLSWHQQFKNDPAMRLVAGLYVACGGGRKSDAQLRSEASELYKKEQERLAKEKQEKSDRKAAERLQKEERRIHKNKERAQAGQRATKQFNFKEEKPLILNTLATSQQASTALVNALQHVNREKESVTENARVQDYLARVKTERKKIIRYIQLVHDEEFVGGLIVANEQIILALQLYDKLAKPIDPDSDEEPLAAINSSGPSAEERAQAKADAFEAEIDIVRQRIANARLSAPDGELEKLQDRQRERIERLNSYRSQAGDSGSGSGHGRGAMDDLRDLRFDDPAPPSSLLPAPLEPSRNTMARSPDATSYNHGSLSDYSDYDSDSEGGHEPRHHSCEPSHGAGDNPSGSGHVPKIGAQHSLLDDDEEEDEGGDDGDDPFADPFYGEPAQPEIYRPAAGRQGSGVV